MEKKVIDECERLTRLVWDSDFNDCDKSLIIEAICEKYPGEIADIAMQNLIQKSRSL